MPTIKDVARLANVSVATVSYVLNNSGSVTAETRLRVLEAIQRLDYRPNVIAQSLQRRQTQTIGFVLSSGRRSLSDPFLAEFIAAMGDRASQDGFYLLITTCPQPERERAVYEELVKTRRVDGIVVTDTQQNDPRLAYLLAEGVPLAAFGRSSENLAFPYVDVDGTVAVRRAVEHLIHLGHERVALIELPNELVCAAHRRQGYMQALVERGLPMRSEWLCRGDLTEESGYRAMQRLLALPEPPTAVVACSDLMAIGAMKALLEHKIRPGKDMALIGFDDVPLAAHVSPALTTLRQPIQQVAECLIDMIIRQIRQEPIPNPAVLLQAELRVRESG